MKEGLRLAPENPFSLAYYARHLAMYGRLDEAEIWFNKLEQTHPNFPLLPLFKARFFAAKGNKEKALSLSEDDIVYSLLGMTDEAINAMQQRIKEGYDYRYLYLVTLPYFDNLRNDPRFKEMVKEAKIRHEEYLRKFGTLD